MAVLISDMKDGIFAITSGTESLFSVKAPERSFWPISMVYNAPAKCTWLSIPVLLDYRTLGGAFGALVSDCPQLRITFVSSRSSTVPRRRDRLPTADVREATATESVRRASVREATARVRACEEGQEADCRERLAAGVVAILAE
nr:hypothetical protein Iba_chr04dCG13860 [Ipomoea batatas]